MKSADPVKVVTVRTASFQAAGEGGSAAIEAVSAAGDAGLSRFVGQEIVKSDRPELSAAKIVVSGGRAMASAENFKSVIEPLADKLGAAVGASARRRGRGYAHRTTGRSARPARSWLGELYVAVGISARSSISPA